MASKTITLIEELSSLSKRPDFASDTGAQTRALYLSKQLGTILQKPEDAALELSFYPTYAAAARVAIDMKLFHLVAASPDPISAVELAEASGGAATLIVRLLRPLAALGFAQEVGENRRTATLITKVMCTPAMQAMHIHLWDNGTTALTKMHSFFKQDGYRQPEDPLKGIFQYAFETDKETFEYFHSIPGCINNFNTAMAANRGSRPRWTEWWPVETQLFQGIDMNESDVLLVDIAGGRGHDVEAFKNKFPNKNGRLVLEDLPAVIDDIKQLDPEIERVKYDFFTPQPIKGARVYFFHFILHDWSDEVCLKILSHTTAAMKKGYSKLLLNEFILPNHGCPAFHCGFDLHMMAMHAAQERTESHWNELLEKVGLKVISFRAPEGGGEGIVEAELA